MASRIGIPLIEHRTQTGNIWPPPVTLNENETERFQRLAEESRALRVSEAIDQGIELEKAEKRKRKPDTKILLLGTFLLVPSHTVT